MSDADKVRPNQDQPSQSGPLDWRARLLLPLVLASISALALLGWLLLRGSPSTPTLSPLEVSSTREAVQFATAEAARQATREAVAPTRTAAAQATATAATHERETAAARTSTAEAHARSTAQAPVTQTAQAHVFETARAQAEATASTLTTLSTLVYGPSSGTLAQTEGNQASQVACDFSRITLSDFIAEATFHNPETPPPAWDYGIIFSNLEDESEHRLILDADGSWTLNLHSSGFDISNRDTTPLLDLSPTGSNTLKLFVADATGYLFINGHYIDTLDLTMFGLDQSIESEHDISVCTGIMEGNAITGRPVIYDHFTIWSLP